MRKRAKKIAIVCLLAAAALRLCLPALLLRVVNRKLGLLQGYQGHVGRIGLSVWRGAYRLESVKIEKNGGKVPVPFFSAAVVDFTLGWAALVRLRIVTDIRMRSPKLEFVKGPTEETSATEPNESFARTLKALAPFDIDRLEIVNGEIRYRDFNSAPRVDIALTDVRATARNLRNSEEADAALPADIEVKAKAFESGDLTVSLKANPLSAAPAFELKQTLSGVDVTKLNDFFEAYAKVRAKKGTFGLYAEAAAKDGRIVGYAKPIFNGLEIDKRANGKTGRQVWAVVVSAVEWIFSNRRRKQVATKIRIDGPFGDARVGLWPAVGGALKNAYIKALTPVLDGLGGTGAKEVPRARLAR